MQGPPRRLWGAFIRDAHHCHSVAERLLVDDARYGQRGAGGWPRAAPALSWVFKGQPDCPCFHPRWSVDQLDQRAPGLVEWLLWAQGLASLALHIITTGVNLGVIWVSG